MPTSTRDPHCPLSLRHPAANAGHSLASVAPLPLRSPARGARAADGGGSTSIGWLRGRGVLARAAVANGVVSSSNNDVVSSSNSRALSTSTSASSNRASYNSGGTTTAASSSSSRSSSSSSSGSSGSSGSDISDAAWGEVVRLLGDMAATKGRPNAAGGWRDAFEYMPVHLQRAGLTPQRLASLNFIHVAGTKGKGSTCAMVESVLRRCGYRTGLYTSPHLVDVRERIRVDGQMLPRAEFAASFWRVYGALRDAAAQDAAATGGGGGGGSGTGVTASGSSVAVGLPSFFSFMTIMAMDALLARPAALRPHVVVLEVGIGGRLDATNGVVTPGSLAAAAVTSLGFDHMELLGDTLPKIAREKAGVMKAGRPVVVAPQPQDAMEALQEVAERVGSPLWVPPPLGRYSLTACGAQEPSAREVVGLGGEHMRLNASLAVALAAEWERQYGAAAAAAAAPAAGKAGDEAAASTPSAVAAAVGRPLALMPGGPSAEAAAARAEAVRSLVLPAEYGEGLRTVRWPGRSQVIHDTWSASPGGGGGGRLTLYLDGAHTPESMATCAAWFGEEMRRAAAEEAGAAPARHSAALLFNCMRDRDPAVLLAALAGALQCGLQGQEGQEQGQGKQPPVVLDAALFSPMLSGGGVLLPAAGAAPAAAPGTQQQPQAEQPATDLSWQERMREVWATLPPSSPPSPPPPSRPSSAPSPPASAAMRSSSSASPPGAAALPRVSVAPSLPAALAAARAAAAADPGVHLHLLVTGSLYLVGDVLRLLGKAPE